MLARAFSFGALIVGGIIAADFLANPAGTTAAGNVIESVDKTNTNALLGKAS